jgi:hypothetical protein
MIVRLLINPKAISYACRSVNLPNLPPNYLYEAKEQCACLSDNTTTTSLAMETSSSSALYDGSVEKVASSGKTDPAAHPAELQHESLAAAKVDANKVDDFPDGGLRGQSLRNEMKPPY